jgi:hypothetical protein
MGAKLFSILWVLSLLSLCFGNDVDIWFIHPEPSTPWAPHLQVDIQVQVGKVNHSFKCSSEFFFSRHF